MSTLSRFATTTLTLVILCFALLTTANADVVVLQPAVDGSVRDGLHAARDGIADQVLEHSVVQALNTNRPGLPFEDRGIIEFNISDLSQPVTNAILTLNVAGAMGPFPFNIGVFTYSG